VASAPLIGQRDGVATDAAKASATMGAAEPRPDRTATTAVRVLGGFFLIAALILPWVTGTFYTRLAIEAMLLGTVALSVGILLGYAGLLSLGQAAYFGLAAYTTALLYLHVTTSFWLVLLAVTALVAAVSAVLGMVAIRAKGVYFALITFGGAEIFSKIAHNTRAIGGSDGLIGIPVPNIPFFPGVNIVLGSNLAFYYVVLAVILALYFGIRRLLDTPFGSVLQAIRDNSERVVYLGYNPFWYKLLAYILAAEVAALGGLFYPMLRGFVAPHLLGFEVSTKAVVMTLVGGVGTLIGPLLGGVLITFLETVIGSHFERHLIVLGVIFIVFVLFLPDGLAGLSRRWLGLDRSGGAR
jgi:branched-chain amino acid transport system permease protein